MNNNMTKTANSCIWEVHTSIGTFTVYFPCGVFNTVDNFLKIPRAIRDFEFIPLPERASQDEEAHINELNHFALEEELNKAIYFGTPLPQVRVSLHWDDKKVYVI